MRISFGRRHPIGLDVGSRWVKAAQYAPAGGRLKHVAGAAFPRIAPDAPLSADELKQIAAVLRRQGFVGREVVISAPADKLRSGILELPAKGAGVPMEGLARAEFARVHKMDARAAEVSWWELPASSRAGKGTAVMAVGCPHADAEPWVDCFEMAGFRVQALDTPTSALARGCLPLAEGTRTFGALEMGAGAGVLVLVRDGTVIYERRIQEAGLSKLSGVLESRIGAGRDAAEYVIREVGLTAEGDPEDRFGEARGLIARHIESTVAEVRRTLAYASHQYPDAAVEMLLLCGGGACIPGLKQYVAGRVDADVRIAAFDEKDEELSRRCGGFYPACAVGLARFS